MSQTPQPEFSRTEMLLGSDGLNALKNACVAVFGIGGVGSYVTEALARSGVGRLILIDSDTVDAVSYTHLDVYKRQETNNPRGFQSKAGLQNPASTAAVWQPDF